MTKTPQMSFGERIKGAALFLFGYDAVKNTRSRRNRGQMPVRSEETELNQVDRQRLISTLLNFKRNNPIVKAISRLRKTDVIGSGIKPQPFTDDGGFNDSISDWWEQWSENPEVTKTMDMVALQKEIADAPLFQGDIGVLKTRGGLLQLIEGTRIGNQNDTGSISDANPNKNGVTVSKLGKPVHYHIGDRINGSLRNVRRIPARDMVLYYKRMRASQWRGVPELAPVVNCLQDVDEYEQIEMLSAKVSASLSAVVKKEGAAQFEIANRLPEDEQDTEGRLQHFEPGTFHYLEEGEDIETISANGRPNVDGIEWCTYKIRQVGAAVGIPVEMILSTIGESSFSASQGLILQYQTAIEEEQRGIAAVMNEIYKWRVRKWIADGDIVPPVSMANPFKVRWQTPAFRWINRAQQVQADARYLQMGALSLDDISSQFGDTAESSMRRKAQNIVLAKRLADEYGLDNFQQLFNQYNVNASADYGDIVENVE